MEWLRLSGNREHNKIRKEERDRGGPALLFLNARKLFPATKSFVLTGTRH
jgi:hypothetical protein